MDRTQPVPGLTAAVAVGERVFLRTPQDGDLPAFVALVESSRAFHREWEPWVDISTQDRFRHMQDVNRKGTSLKLLVCRKRDGVLLGMMNVNGIVRGVAQMASLGYWIGAAHARRGYTSEALGLVVRHAFDAMGLHRLEANIRPENVASIALVTRAGFRKEGYSPRFLEIAGDWRDHERWALLADED